jgi:hypothetical protein
MDHRRDLKEQYKNMKPGMGLYMISSKSNNKCFIEATQNLKGTINGTKFKLGAGNHPNKELQKEWKQKGEKEFTIEIVEQLSYDKDESKTDYSDELALLKLIWQEKLEKSGKEFFRKSLMR